MATTTSRMTMTTASLPRFLSLSLSPASKVIVKGRKTTKRVPLVDGAFQCRTCDRRFATFQALGGHRTSHKRPRVRAHGLDLLLGACPGKGGGGASNNNNNVHRCQTCGTVFPTGQALGGHMRRHRAAFSDEPALETTMPTTMTTLSALSDEERDHDAEDLLHARTLIHFI